MTVETIMSKNVVTVEMDDTLKTIKDIFEHTRFHHLLVVDPNKLFGIISDRDLLKALSPKLGTVVETDNDRATLNKRAHQIMTRKPITLRTKSSIYDAIEIFNNNNISCIPVIDDDDKPVGIISWRDILKTIDTKYRKHSD